MKLNRQLNINNGAYQVIEERVILDLDSPGRAQFLIDAGDKPISAKQIVSFSLGYGGQGDMQRLFFGFIDQVNTVDRRQQLFCRELSATLFAPVSYTHLTL